MGLVTGLVLTLGHRLAENLQRLVLWCRGEGVIAGVFQHFTLLYALIQRGIHRVFNVIRILLIGEHHVHFGRQAAVLAGMSLINEYGKIGFLVYLVDVLQNELELMDYGNDNLRLAFQQFSQLRRILCPANGGRHLHELLDCVADLPVKVDTVCHDNDTAENILAVLPFQGCQLMSQPGNLI